MGNNVTEILIATWFSPLYRIMWRRIAAVVQVDLTDSISVETKVYCLRQRYFVWDEDILSETYKLLLPLQFYSILSWVKGLGAHKAQGSPPRDPDISI